MTDVASDGVAQPATQAALTDHTDAQSLFAKITLAAIAAILGAQLWLVFHVNINWDEFYYLSHIHAHLNGTLARPLQTFYVHLLSWLAGLPADEIGQITAGRLFMLACELGTVALIYGIARQFVKPYAALVGVLAYLASIWTLNHGMSFRADPLVAFLLMSSVYVLMASSLKAWQLGVAALCGALAVLITIKSVLYLPAFAAALVWRLQDREQRAANALRIGVAALTGCACLVALYFWHAGQLNAGSGAVSTGSAGDVFKVTFSDQNFLPRIDEVTRWFGANLVALMLVAGGLAHKGWPRTITLALLVAPLLSVLFYRNAFAYFFPFIIPPVMVVAAVGVPLIAKRRVVLIGLIGCLVFGAGLEFKRGLDRGQTAQRQTLEAVHAMFPKPVRYIDRSAMVGSFPRSGFFMSTWGIETYKRRGKAIFGDILRTEKPVMLITNSPTLQAAMHDLQVDRPEFALFADDAAVLRDNFVHHWGDIWVAGKRLEASATPHRFDIAIDGVYTLEGEAGVQLDGRTVAPGTTVELTQGEHVVSASGPGEIVLRWGDNLHRPDHQPSDQKIFHAF